MKAGEFPDGAHVLRLKIDLASPNINMRDPAIYRIRHATHHRTGDKWCIYPLYDYTHCISDALERITHSICTLEFQDHRPLYDWVIENLADAGLLPRPLPQQYEFARLNLTYTVMSKRKLLELVEGGHVDGWDDPRMPTLVGAAPARLHAGGDSAVRRAHRRVQGRFVDRHERARGLPARRAERARGAADRGARSGQARDRQLSRTRPRGMPGAEPSAAARARQARACRSRASSGSSATTSWKRRRRATSGSRRAPRCACAMPTSCAASASTRTRRATSPPCTAPTIRRRAAARRAPRRARSRATSTGCRCGTPSALKCACTIACSPFLSPGARARRRRWPPPRSARRVATARRGARTTNAFEEPAERNYLDDLNPQGKQVVAAYVEPLLAEVAPETRYQFERHGYFVADLRDSRPGASVFNRAVTLRDSWANRSGAPAYPFAPSRRLHRRFRYSRPCGRATLCARRAHSKERREAHRPVRAHQPRGDDRSLDRGSRLRARPGTRSERTQPRRVIGLFGSGGIYRRDHLAPDVEVDRQVVDRRASDRQSPRREPGMAACRREAARRQGRHQHAGSGRLRGRAQRLCHRRVPQFGAGRGFQRFAELDVARRARGCSRP